MKKFIFASVAIVCIALLTGCEKNASNFKSVCRFELGEVTKAYILDGSDKCVLEEGDKITVKVVVYDKTKHDAGKVIPSDSLEGSGASYQHLQYFETEDVLVCKAGKLIPQKYPDGLVLSSPTLDSYIVVNANLNGLDPSILWHSQFDFIEGEQTICLQDFVWNFETDAI